MRTTAARQLAVAGLVGAAIATVVTLLTPVNAAYGVLLGWTLGAAVYVLSVWRASWGLDSDRTAQAVVREDPTRAVADIVLLSAAVASLGAVAFTIADASHAHGLAKALRVGMGVASIISSWFVVHTVFTLRYARVYYIDKTGDVDFNTDDPPIWSDFAYLAFTIGMTFQVSDTDLRTSEIRRLALRHMLLSYLFGAVIVSVTINLVVNLTR